MISLNLNNDSVNANFKKINFMLQTDLASEATAAQLYEKLQLQYVNEWQMAAR